MRQSKPKNRAKHLLVLSLTPRSLDLLLLQRSLLGWRRMEHQSVALTEGDDYLRQVSYHLREKCKDWKTEPGSGVYWVLSGDILGVMPPDPTPHSDAAQSLPFPATETRVQADLYAPCENPSVLWIHKDWLAQVERISGQAKLNLLEIFARAQLFQTQSAPPSALAKVVLESTEDQVFLHIYAANGMVLRTTVLTERSREAIDCRIQSELAALGILVSHDCAPTVALLASPSLIPGLPTWPASQPQPLPIPAQAQLLEQLFKSKLEGIVVRPSHEALTLRMQWASAALGVFGLLWLSVMLWHDGKLQEQISSTQGQIQKLGPKVADAKARKVRTLQMADALAAVHSVRKDSGAMDGFAQLLNQFPPPPAHLLYVRADSQTLAFAAHGDDTGVQWLKDKSLPGYGPLTATASPEHLKNVSPEISLQATKSLVNDASLVRTNSSPVAETQKP